MAVAAEPLDSVPFPRNPVSRKSGKRSKPTTKRRRPSASPQPRSAFPTSNQPPEPYSLNDILHKNNRERLFVPPLHWKSQQLQLLQCQFAGNEAKRKSELESTESCAPHGRTRKQPQQQATNRSDETIIRIVTGLSYALSEKLRTCVVRDLLHAYNVHCSSFDLPLRFDQHVFSRLKTSGIFSSSPSASPILAYLDLEAVSEHRDKSVKNVPGNIVNLPIARIRKKLQRSLQPTNELEDPYIAAVLIALAQGRRDRETREGTMADTPSISDAAKTSHETATYKVHLLAHPKLHRKSFYFYTACIPAAFLDRFDQPSRYFPSNPVRILYHRVLLAPEARTSKQDVSLAYPAAPSPYYIPSLYINILMPCLPRRIVRIYWQRVSI